MAVAAIQANKNSVLRIGKRREKKRGNRSNQSAITDRTTPALLTGDNPLLGLAALAYYRRCYYYCCEKMCEKTPIIVSTHTHTHEHSLW